MQGRFRLGSSVKPKPDRAIRTVTVAADDVRCGMVSNPDAALRPNLTGLTGAALRMVPRLGISRDGYRPHIDATAGSGLVAREPVNADEFPDFDAGSGLCPVSAACVGGEKFDRRKPGDDLTEGVHGRRQGRASHRLAVVAGHAGKIKEGLEK